MATRQIIKAPAFRLNHLSHYTGAITDMHKIQPANWTFLPAQKFYCGFTGLWIIKHLQTLS